MNRISLKIAWICIMFMGLSQAFSLEPEYGVYKKKILFVAPHEDDEGIACAGAINRAVEAGHDVRLVLVTTGDYVEGIPDLYAAGEAKARTRLKESITVLKKLGLDKSRIYYLGYADALVMFLYASKLNPTQIIASASQHTYTYGFPDLINDYHYLLTGAHGSYTRQCIIFDIQSILSDFLPNEVYLPAGFETHPDHKGAALFVMEAIIGTKKYYDYAPDIHEYNIYKEGLPQATINPAVPVSNLEAKMDTTSPFKWNERVSLAVPEAMIKPIEPTRLDINPANTNITVNFPALSLQNAFDNAETSLCIADGSLEPLTITFQFTEAKHVELLKTMISEPYSHSVILSGMLEVADNQTDLSNKTGTYVKVFENEEFDGTWREFDTNPVKDKRLWKLSLRKVVYSDNVVCIPEIQFCINANLKASVLRDYDSQGAWRYNNFIHTDEVFWSKALTSLSYKATVTASAESLIQKAVNVIDGNLLGRRMYGSNDYFQNIWHEFSEWATPNGGTSAWVQLNWTSPITANRIVLFDRPDPAVNILRGTLTFSNGFSLAVSALEKYGKQTVIDFAAQTFQWVKLTIDQVEGTNAGLAEFEVYNRSVNIAPLSRVSVSSQNYWTGQFGSKAVDGVIAGFPGDYNKEWATQNQTVNSWIRLDWAQPYTINKVVLYDRPNTGDRITSALLSFSDGSSLLVDSLPNDGSPKSVTFAQKNVSWVKLSILAAAGTSTGLAEFEAFGYPATNNPYKNIAPLARVGVSSEKSPAASNSGWKAIDGVKSGFPSDINYEWSSAGELANAWIRLDWTRDYNVDTVVFYDKPNFDDQIHGALLYLSDGSVVIIDALPNDGTGKVFTFPSKRVNWAKLQIIYATGVNIGLSEWEVFGSPVSE